MGLSLWVSISRTRYFGLHAVPELSWSSDWWLGCLWTVWTCASHRSHLPWEQPFFTQLAGVTTLAGEMDGGFSVTGRCHHLSMQQGECSASSEAQEWPRRAVRAASGHLLREWSGVSDMDIAWNCGGAGEWKETSHLGVTLDPSNVLPIASYSGAMRCRSVVLFFMSNLFTGIFLCSLWSRRCETSYVLGCAG